MMTKEEMVAAARRVFAAHAAPAASRPIPRHQWPKWARMLAKLSTDEDAGLGDTVKRLASHVGGETYKQLRKAIGWPCGCTTRQAAMNQRYPLR